jgi:hypothetical protein
MNLEISLQGYETAVYEIYPAEEASEPLLAGVTFEVLQESESKYTVRFYDAERGARLLNPEKVRTVKYGSKNIKPNKFLIPIRSLPKIVSQESVRLSSQENHPEIEIKFDLHKPAEEATLAVLLEPAGESMGEREPEVTAFLDGEKAELKVEYQKGRWGWYTLRVRPGKHTSRIIIEDNGDRPHFPQGRHPSRIIIAQEEKETRWTGKVSSEANGEEENGDRPHFPHIIVPQGEKENMKETRWTGKVSVWLVCPQRPEGREVSFDLAQKLGKKRPMPPRPWPPGELRKTIKLGELEIRSPSPSK